MSSSLCRFIKEPWVGLKNLEKFLGISHEITEENFFFNATKVSSLLTFILISLLQKDSNIFFWALNFHGHPQGFYCGLQEMTVPSQSPHVWTCTRFTNLHKLAYIPQIYTICISLKKRKNSLTENRDHYLTQADIFFVIDGPV